MVVQVAAAESSSRDGSLSSSSLSPSSRTNGSADVGDATDMRDLIASVLKDRTAEGGAVAKKDSTSPGETCTWYPNKQCTVARSCLDCLNTIIAGSPCMVDPYGVCVSMSKYDVSMDFRRALPPNALQMSMNYFPNTNTTYCANDDRYCSICRKTWSNPFDNSQLSYLRFCRGEGGCVCIQNCDSSFHNDNVIMQRCVATGYTGASARTLYTSVGVMVALCFVFALATIFVRRWVRRVDRNPSRGPVFRHDQRLPQREPTGPQLGLSGWLSMREKLIQTEREQLNTNDNQTLEMPVIDHVDGPTVIMEAGEGYLPASPSDLISQHAFAGERRERSTSEPAIQTNPTNNGAARPTGNERMSEV